MDKQQAIELIRIVKPDYNNVDIEITHMGELDSQGSKHPGSLITIEFRAYHYDERIVIWNDGIKYFRKSIVDELADVFAAHRYLISIGLLKN